jgi:hypothetical protein
VAATVSDDFWTTFYRLSGSASGAFVSLAFTPPKTTVEAIRRGGCSLIVGAAFEPYVLPHLSSFGVQLDANGVFVSALLAAFVTWTALSWPARWLEAWEAKRLNAVPPPPGGAPP